MNSQKKRTTKTTSITALVGLTLLGVGGGTARTKAVDAAPSLNAERQATTVQSKFYCNTKALTPAERARHKELGDKLMRVPKDVVELEKGYEFQYSPSDVSILELADWVAAEGKCCPFFDFHIDLEREGALLCLRLTGPEGIKAFIRSEFQVGAK
jgi:hypothetical protein